MSTDVSASIFDLFSGKKRARALPTLAIALVVTSIVAIPLILQAIDDSSVEDAVVLAPADASKVLVDTAAGDPSPLDLTTVSGSILVSLRDETATAVSFGLYSAGADDAILSSTDVQGPQFDLIVSDSGGGAPFDTAQLPNGDYELFVTIRTPQEDRRTALSFQVQNP